MRVDSPYPLFDIPYGGEITQVGSGGAMGKVINWRMEGVDKIDIVIRSTNNIPFDYVTGGTIMINSGYINIDLTLVKHHLVSGAKTEYIKYDTEITGIEIVNPGSGYEVGDKITINIPKIDNTGMWDIELTLEENDLISGAIPGEDITITLGYEDLEQPAIAEQEEDTIILLREEHFSNNEVKFFINETTQLVNFLSPSIFSIRWHNSCAKKCGVNFPPIDENKGCSNRNPSNLLNSSFGWKLGFRSSESESEQVERYTVFSDDALTSYVDTGKKHMIKASSIWDEFGTKYLILEVDDFNRNRNSGDMGTMSMPTYTDKFKDTFIRERTISELPCLRKHG